MEKDEKQQLVPLLFVLIALIIILSNLYTFSKKNGLFETKLDRIGDILEINLEQGQIVKLNEQPWYQKFVDNGDCLIKITCSEQTDKDIKFKWKSLPVSSDIERAFPFDERISAEYRIPKIEKGYYYFKNRAREDVKTINEFDHCTLAVYDSENCILYFYTRDY